MGNKGAKDASGKKVSAKRAKLSSKELKLLSSKTGFTVPQLEDFYAKFNNNNPDGLLNRDEFNRLYQQLRTEPVGNIDEIQTMVFRAFDSDNNGSLTFEEFLVGYALTSRGDQRAKLEFAFEMYDADNNGSLNQSELKEVLTCMLDLLSGDKSQVNALAVECGKLLDTSGDGKISKDEFINGLMKNYNLRVLMQPFN